MLKTYSDFIEYINQYKIVPFSKILEGFDSLGDLTNENNWHTGIDSSDPWRWKDIAAQRKDCAYGCMLGGKKGFVSIDILPIFYAAFAPVAGIDDIYMSGKLSKTTYDAWKRIYKAGEIAIFDLRVDMGVTKKKGASTLDASLRDLQQMMFISICASRQKINKQGLPYGWRSNVYSTFERWAGAKIVEDAKNYDKDEAQNIVLDTITDNFSVDKGNLKKLFKL
ncbi:MAG: hypothetical protein KAQ68_11645 [Clostridiales bacterium]|nr:hypothetical protein [Clostridiales bacterium]